MPAVNDRAGYWCAVGLTSTGTDLVEWRLPAVSMDGPERLRECNAAFIRQDFSNCMEQLPVGRSPGAETGEDGAGGSTNPKVMGHPGAARAHRNSLRDSWDAQGSRQKMSQREELFIPLLFYCYTVLPLLAYHKIIFF